MFDKGLYLDDVTFPDMFMQLEDGVNILPFIRAGNGDGTSYIFHESKLEIN